MQRSYLPFLFFPTPAASRVLGRRGPDVALLALRAVLSHHRSLDVAHQQVRYAGQDYAFSSRVTAHGDLVVDLDIGDPRLQDRIVLESELKAATRVVRGIAQEHRRPRTR